MILPVRHEDVTVGVDGDPLQSLELARAGAPASEAAKEGPVGIKDLDPVVPAVRNENVSLVVYGNSSAILNHTMKILQISQ